MHPTYACLYLSQHTSGSYSDETLKELAGKRRNLLFQFVEPSLKTHLQRVHGGELKHWLLHRISGVEIPPEVKASILLQSLDKNAALLKSLIQIFCTEHPNKIAQLLVDDTTTIKKFFSESDDRIRKWFAHFNFSGRAKYGALALEHYAFVHRSWFWDDFLVWSSPRPVTPITAAQQRHLMMHLNVVATVRRLLKNLDQFWRSEDWIECLQSGEFLKIDTSFWIDHLVKSFAEDDRVRRNLREIIREHATATPWRTLCDTIVATYSDADVKEILREIRQYIWQQAKNMPIGLDKAIMQFLSKCHPTEEGQWQDVLFVCALACDNRNSVVRSLVAEEGNVWKESLRNAIDQNALPAPSLSSPDEPVLKLPLLLTEDLKEKDNKYHGKLFPLVHAMDNVSHYALMQQLGCMNVEHELTIEQLKFLLLETLLVHYRLLSAQMTKEEAEHFMDIEGVPFEIIERIKVKRRKHSSKPSDTKQKVVFVGWKLHLPSQSKSQSENGASTKDADGNADNERKQIKRTYEDINPSLTVGLADLPGLLALETLAVMIDEMMPKDRPKR